MLQKYSLGFFCDWCFVTVPSYLVKDPGDEEYKKIYIQCDCFFSMRKKTHFILITWIKSREKPALSQEIKSPGNVHICNFSIGKTFHQFHVAHSFSFNCFNTFIWMLPVHSTFSFYDTNARTHLFNMCNVWGSIEWWKTAKIQPPQVTWFSWFKFRIFFHLKILNFLFTQNAVLQNWQI